MNKAIKARETEKQELLRKGLTDKKVIDELITFKHNNPVLYNKRLPTEMYDKVNLMCRKYMDRMARFEMDYDFIVDAEMFRNVAVCCLESVPVLRSQVVNHPVSPYWRLADYTVDDFVFVKEVGDIEKARAEFFAREIPLTSNVQMNIALFYNNNKTYICFIWNHMCMDGGGFKMFWSDFCRNYTQYDLDGISPLSFSTGSRKYTDVYKDMARDKAKKARLQFANISPRSVHGFPFRNNKKEDSVIIVSRKIPSESFIPAREFAKSSGATVTDLLLASYIDSLAKISDISPESPISVACATDLRRHIKDLSTVGYTNHVSFIHCALSQRGNGLKDTLEKVSEKTRQLKKDEFIGLHGLPLLNIAYKTMVYLQAETVVKLFYNNPSLSVSNVGVIVPESFSLSGNMPFDAFVAGAAKNKPCAVMTALTINDTLSVSMCLRGNENDKKLLERFFDEYVKNINSCR